MHRTVVNLGIDPDLDEMKRKYDGLGDLLSEVTHDIAETVPAVFDIQLNVIFFPQIGFLIATPKIAATGKGAYEGGEDEDNGWETIFATIETVYYKDSRMRELDENIGDLYAAVCGKLCQGYPFLNGVAVELTQDFDIDQEIDIVHELGQQILAQEEMLKEASDLCGELDRWELKTSLAYHR